MCMYVMDDTVSKVLEKTRRYSSSQWGWDDVDGGGGNDDDNMDDDADDDDDDDDDDEIFIRAKISLTWCPFTSLS